MQVADLPARRGAVVCSRALVIIRMSWSEEIVRSLESSRHPDDTVYLEVIGYEAPICRLV
jgi:hypothetical protein